MPRSPDTPRTPDAHVLLLHDAFLRRVARGLVRQAADADDLVQETYARALRSGPRAGKSVRAWLRVIAQRAAWRRGAREADRPTREARAAPPRAAPTAAAAWEREALRQRVVQAVLALPPRDCEVLTLRYLEDLSLGEVAQMLELPIETVRTRQKRALSRLRQRLEREHPDTVPALIGLAGLRPAALPIVTLAGAVLMKYILAGALVLLLALGIWSTLDRSAPDPDATGPVADAAGPTLVGRENAATDARADATPPPSADAPSTEVVIAVHDRVTGLPVPGPHARRARRTGLQTIVPDATGLLRIQTRATAVVEIGAAGYVTRRMTLLAGDTSTNRVELMPLLQLSSWRVLSGVVVNGEDEPVEGARITLTDMSWWTYETLHLTSLSDAAGRFELTIPGSSGVNGHKLRAHHPTEGDGRVEADYRKPSALAWGGAHVEDVTQQQGIRIVLRPARSFPVRLEGSSSARGGTYVLDVRPAAHRYDAVLAEPRRERVSDGDAVALRLGVWTLRLLDETTGDLIARPLYVEVHGETAFRTVPRPTPGWEDATWTQGDAVTDLPFALVERTTIVRITADGAPAGGAQIRVESADDADPRRVHYAERNAAGGVTSSGILTELQPGRRVLDSRARTGTTDETGTLTLRGWLPEPALLWIHGDGIVDRFERIERWDDTSTWEVSRGGILHAHLAPWMGRGVTLRRKQDDELILVRKRDLPLTLPPGEYVARVRQWGRDGRTPQDRELAPPFVLRAGTEHTLDLRSVPAPMSVTLRLRPAMAHGTVRLRRRGHFPNRDIAFVNGEARWDVTAIGRGQAVVAWAQANGVHHEHRVMLEGALSNADETAARTYELDYDAGSIALSVEHRGTRAMVMALSGRDLRAPHDYGHTARVALEPGRTADAIIGDLPEGTYRVWIGDPEHTSSVQTLQVRAGQVTRLEATVERSATTLELRPKDRSRPIADLDRGWVSLRGPKEAPRPGGHLGGTGTTIQAGGRAEFRKLAPGTYEVQVSWPGDTWSEPGRSGRHFVDVGSIQVKQAVQTHTLTVPTREK